MVIDSMMIMRSYLFTLLLLLSTQIAHAGFFKKLSLSGVYMQWGYNRDWFSNSDLHFKDGSNYDFTLHNVKAKDKPDFSAFKTNPLDITIPQNSCRLGVYLNKEHTHGIELNFDHAKYVVGDNQSVRITGEIRGREIDKDTVVARHFVHLEHTNGANFFQLNYVGQHSLTRNRKKKYSNTSVIYKAGAGILVPRSYVVVMSRYLDNNYHVAGYVISAEAGLRYYPFRHLFLEATIKNGFAKYLDVLGESSTSRIHHHFFYGEVIGLIGVDVGMRKPRKAKGAK